MEKVWRGKFLLYLYLYLGSWRGIMFPERGAAIPVDART